MPARRNSKVETCHFWVGRVPEMIAGEYFVETYHKDREESPVSRFAEDQGAKWYNHDALEYGWGTADTIEALVSGYSYSEQWAEELAQRVSTAGLQGINFFVFINEEEIEHPKSVHADEYWLEYMGTIEYRI